MITPEQRQIIINKLESYLPTKLGVFGSYARDQNVRNSDLDLLVEFGVRINLLDLIGLEQELTEVLGIKVDLVTESSLSKYMRPYIEMDLKSLI